MSSNKTTQPGIFYGYVIVLLGFFVMMAMYGTVNSYGIFLKPMLNDLGLTVAMTSGAFSLALFIRGIASLVTGKLTDVVGPRVVVTAGAFFLGVGYLLMSQTRTGWQLYLFYGVVVAFGQACGFVPILSTVARWFTKRRATMTGIVVAGSGIGVMILAPIVRWLISTSGWRNSFLILGITVLVLVNLSAWFIKRDPGKMGLASYGADESKAENTPDFEVKGFSFQEAIRTWQLWMIGFIFLAYMYCIQTVLVHIVNHAIELGIPAVSAANILAITGGISVIGRIGLGYMADRFGSRVTLGSTLVLLSLSLIWVTQAKELWMFYLFALLFGITWGAGPMVVHLLSELFGQKALGALVGLNDLMTNIGGMLGPLLAGIIFDVKGSYQLAFLIAAALSTTNIILLSLLRPPRKRS